jgi:hypothetical protein
MAGAKPPDAYNAAARYLPVVQVVLAVIAFIVWVVKPYVMVEILQWLGPTTHGYARNPAIAWLLLLQFPLILLWALSAKPKAPWQWVCMVAGLGISIVPWILTMNPPSWLG